jgi:hypothetical protein
MTEASNQPLLYPCIKDLLISEYDWETVHMRISLEGFPVDLSVDEALEGISRCSIEDITILVEYPSRDDIEFFSFKSILKVFSLRSA